MNISSDSHRVVIITYLTLMVVAIGSYSVKLCSVCIGGCDGYCVSDCIELSNMSYAILLAALKDTRVGCSIGNRERGEALARVVDGLT